MFKVEHVFLLVGSQVLANRYWQIDRMKGPVLCVISPVKALIIWTSKSFLFCPGYPTDLARPTLSIRERYPDTTESIADWPIRPTPFCPFLGSLTLLDLPWNQNYLVILSYPISLNATNL